MILKYDILILDLIINPTARSVPLSRSWNRIVADAGLEKNNFNLLLKTWSGFP